MVLCKALSKITDSKGNTTGYTLIDTTGQIMNVSSQAIKTAMLNKQVDVINLKITSDNRLIICENKAKDFQKDTKGVIHAVYVDKSIYRYLNQSTSQYDNKYPTITLMIPYTESITQDRTSEVTSVLHNYILTKYTNFLIITAEYSSITKAVRSGKLVVDNMDIEVFNEKDLKDRVKSIAKQRGSKSYATKYGNILCWGYVDFRKKAGYNSATTVTEDFVWEVIDKVHSITQIDLEKPLFNKKLGRATDIFNYQNIQNHKKQFDKYCELFTANLLKFMWYNMDNVQYSSFCSKINRMMGDIYSSDNPRFNVYSRWLPYGDDTFQDCVVFIILYYGKQVFDTFRKVTRKEELVALGVDFGNMTKYAEDLRFTVTSYIDYED